MTFAKWTLIFFKNFKEQRGRVRITCFVTRSIVLILVVCTKPPFLDCAWSASSNSVFISIRWYIHHSSDDYDKNIIYLFFYEKTFLSCYSKVLALPFFMQTCFNSFSTNITSRNLFKATTMHIIWILTCSYVLKTNHTSKALLVSFRLDHYSAITFPI